jgi:hypothetical protein
VSVPRQPADRPWRIVAIGLDDEEHVASLTVQVHAAIVDRIRELIDNGVPIEVLSAHAGPGTPATMQIEISRGQARRLLAAAGDLPRKDPRNIPGLYASLSRFAAIIEEN